MLSTGKDQGEYFSDLIRIWQDSNSESDSGWRGEVIHIQAGKTWCFSGRQPLLEFISAQIAQIDRTMD